MMDALRVRIYNVRFGDGILLTIPDRDKKGKVTERHILIDVGNALNKEGGADAVFKPVVADIVEELAGRPLDLYIMTHEHMDHIQGLPYAERYVYTQSETQLRDLLNTQYAWLTASAAEDYRNTHPKAEKAELNFERDYAAISSYIHSSAYVEASGAQQLAYMQTLLDINNPRSSQENVDYLRKLARHTYYVYRGVKLGRKHPFKETKFEIWAPEEDTSVYYGNYQSPALGVAEEGAGAGESAWQECCPPAGVDASAFYNLIEARRQCAESLLAIDKAQNNTSVVCCIEWRGWRLLFTGDAEIKSWKIMKDQNQLREVDFLKISHHGSHNGTPGESILDVILPKRAAKGKERRAAVSTWRDTYSGVPDAATLKRLYDPAVAGLQPRCDSLAMVNESISNKLYEDFFFEG
ncbi:MAG: hypothetical protein HPY72_00070 [Anaerolineae bacterium]|nr:hypothetical protein [Anaerolineae bacterium]